MNSSLRRYLLSIVVILFAASSLNAEQVIRIATYNIKWLNADDLQTTNGKKRKDKLKSVIAELDADIIALQEIKDREALEAIFEKTSWHLIIDDNSNNNQDLALAVSKNLQAKTRSGDDDADDSDFLFSGPAHNYAFPGRRDVLAVNVTIPQANETITVMVVHSKARVGGRLATTSKRVSAAKSLIERLEQDYDGKKYVVLGDFNASPDDRSLNILETGDPDADAEMENSQGDFLVNLAESLWAENQVTHGLNSSDVHGGQVNTVDPGSRQRDFNVRNSNDRNIHPVMFDQILVPDEMLAHYMTGSIEVMATVDSVKGNSKNRASDHVPVVADFWFGENDSDVSESTIRISSVLPNPEGADRNNEQVTISNSTNTSVNLTGWKLCDADNHQYELSGSVGANSSVTITLQNTLLSLNNTGDDVILKDENGDIVSHVTYSRSDAKSGVVLEYE